MAGRDVVSDQRSVGRIWPQTERAFLRLVAAQEAQRRGVRQPDGHKPRVPCTCRHCRPGRAG